MIPVTNPLAIFRSASIYTAIQCTMADPEMCKKIEDIWDNVDVHWLAGHLGSGKKEPLASWLVESAQIAEKAWSLLLDHPHPFLPLYQIIHSEDPGAMASHAMPEVVRILEKRKVWESKKYRQFLVEVRKVSAIRKVQEA